ncbi:MAG TPA: NAD(P)H-binding protein, partial [Polyangiaceae bacterium]|nr:NAD(P)H-binding protein [Polyangiaceae bacterium]
MLDRGHHVIALTRDVSGRRPRAGLEYRALDFMRPQEPASVIDLVGDADVLINAVGIIREGRGLTFQRVHVETPVSLFAAAQTAHLKRIVQLSAAGTSEESPFAYFRSKAKADDFLLNKCAVPSLVLRPSLIYGTGGEATKLFRRLAALPVVPLPAGGAFSFRPILVEDVARLVLEGVEREPMPRGVVEVGGADELTLKELLLALRADQGTAGDRSGLTLPIPKALMKPAAWLGDWTGAGP